MKPKHIFCLALGLICGVTALAITTQVLDYSEGDYRYQKQIITKLGKSFEIRELANSWASLIGKVKPAFAWNNCDFMWIKTDTNGQPQFTLDEAYIYQPTNQPRQWVLLDRRSVSYNDLFEESPRFFYSGENFHALATLRSRVPEIRNDAGERGDYAVALGADPRYGTVYEIGWQREMGCGTAHPCYGRRIYLMKDHSNLWHFLGEGPEEGGEHGGEEIVRSQLVWNDREGNDLPLEIRFRCESYSYGDTGEEDPNGRMEVRITNEFVLAGKFPAQCRKRK